MKTSALAVVMAAALLFPAMVLAQADYRIPDANARLRDLQQLRERLDAMGAHTPVNIHALPAAPAQAAPAVPIAVPTSKFAPPPAPPAALGQPAGPGRK